MSDAETSNFTAIIALSEAMLRCAEQGDWLQLAALESQRRALIETHMALTPANGTAAYIHAARRLLTLDERTLSLAIAGRASVAKQIQTFNTGRHAVQAYTQQSP